jgi:hypothetical protein
MRARPIEGNNGGSEFAYSKHMLFGRLRSPYSRVAAEIRGLRALPPPSRGESARLRVSLVPSPPFADRGRDDYAGLDRLDREELDE